MSRHTTSPTGALPEIDHLLGEDARVVERLHERAVADLDVEHDRVRPCGDLLRHDRGGDERHDVDRRGHVPQAVEALVSRHEIRRRADDRKADVAHLLDELVGRELDPEAGDRLELVERAAGVTETATAHLPEGNAARRDDRANRDRSLVPHAARRVLVDDAPAERRAHVERLARLDERLRQRVGLGAGEPPEVDGHAPRGHLVVGDLAGGVARHESHDLLSRVLPAVPLPLDEVGGADHSSIARPGSFLPGDLPPSQEFTV